MIKTSVLGAWFRPEEAKQPSIFRDQSRRGKKNKKSWSCSKPPLRICLLQVVFLPLPLRLRKQPWELLVQVQLWESCTTLPFPAASETLTISLWTLGKQIVAVTSEWGWSSPKEASCQTALSPKILVWLQATSCHCHRGAYEHVRDNNHNNQTRSKDQIELCALKSLWVTSQLLDQHNKPIGGIDTGREGLGSVCQHASIFSLWYRNIYHFLTFDRCCCSLHKYR